MPLTGTGENVLESMKTQYGPTKGKSVFYASINAGKSGSDKWHLKDQAAALEKRRKGAGR